MKNVSEKKHLVLHHHGLMISENIHIGERGSWSLLAIFQIILVRFRACFVAASAWCRACLLRICFPCGGSCGSRFSFALRHYKEFDVVRMAVFLS
jgi:hypothetical protein